MNFLLTKLRGLFRRLLKPMILDIIMREIRLWGPRERLDISSTAYLGNTYLNTVSGRIVVGEYTFSGPSASIITGTHRYEMLMKERMDTAPDSGRDIMIGKGVWIGANAIILGPCTIGDHAVIAAGALVKSDVPPFTVVGGIPARPLKTIQPDVSEQLKDARATPCT